MHLLKKILLIFSLLFLLSCSSSYKELSSKSHQTNNELSKYLYEAYKEKADFEAKQMHDWNSAKLYSEKALDAIEGKEVKPQEINYWNISFEKKLKLNKGYNNLQIIYLEAKEQDPLNLAIAVSSLDCWGEQEEESWQSWDIKKCQNDFLNAMHLIYKNIDKNQKKASKKLKFNSNIKNTLIKQIVYFDFDNTELTNLSVNKIKDFIKDKERKNNKYLIEGHTDTAGSKEYNLKLSLERARTVKEILISLGIENQYIKIIGIGEDQLKILTMDKVSHPANRRAEIHLLN